MSAKEDLILVVDDEEPVRDVVSKLVKHIGYPVLMAANGKQALDLMRKEPVTILITDIKMPVMDGLQLLQEIRKMGSKTDVIMVTAYGEVESYLKAMSLGAAEYINKPIRIKELKQIVHKVLTEQRTRPGS